MNPTIRAIAQAYCDSVDGDLRRALEMAIGDLIEVKAEADFRAQALDQWVSRGYVQGRASELCDRQARRDADPELFGPLPESRQRASGDRSH